ncbi:hypothetical protein K402DRAFT_173952 [Aulographum hederae CBS 113979]|uniref:Uncharacterized protein n=1 Tax=Aulographum hederae CBS 113979 TaxID=1176131 RepID=A0A6G1HDE4_9PEZI|nr:hypothetical protein K402DRAFT_173952 [Aulographum hederae CBS 113979]
MPTPVDTESNNSRTPMVNRPRHKAPKGFVRSVLKFLGSGILSPRATTYEPLVLLLNTPDVEKRNKLTEQWRDNKLSELNFVGIVSALLTGVLTSTGSWPTILPNGMESPWPVRCSWYCGIILGLASILGAADQSIRLHRLSSHRDALPHIRHLLSSNKRDDEGRILPRRMQVYTWQLPVTFLACSALCMIVGMFVLVWAATLQTYEGNDWWDENSKVAVTFTIVAGLTAVFFFMGQISLYSPMSELGEDD